MRCQVEKIQTYQRGTGTSKDENRKGQKEKRIRIMCRKYILSK